MVEFFFTSIIYVYDFVFSLLRSSLVLSLNISKSETLLIVGVIYDCWSFKATEIGGLIASKVELLAPQSNVKG